MNGRLGATLVTCVAVLSSFLALVPSASAQTGGGLQVKPAIIDDTVVPGQTYTFAVTVTNLAPTERTVTVSAQDISGLDNEGRPVFAAPLDVTGYSLSSWIVLPQGPITLQAGETREVPVSAHVPMSVSPGAHFGGVFFSTSGQQTARSAVALTAGTVLNLQIAGYILEDARLRAFSTDQLVYGSPLVTITTTVENLGNVLVRPHGSIEVRDLFGTQVAAITINGDGAPIFPNSSRAYTSVWRDGGFAIGRYRAVLSLSYGTDGRKTITSTTSFWILSLPLLGVIAGGLLALAAALYLGLKAYIRRQLRAMRVPRGREADAALYRREYQRSGSRLILIVFTLALLCVMLLIALFLLLA